jgi:lipid II:glycine glycyltransferase (peptidoglycan interpeptide bridge formation enzyme)
MNQLTLFEFEKKHADEWDAFVLNSPAGSIHQISDWAPFQETITGRGPVKGWGVRDAKGQIQATVLCVWMDTGFRGKKWVYSPRGPVFDMHKNQKAGQFLIQSVSEKLKESGAMFWRLDPYIKPGFWIQLQKLEPGLALKTSIQNYQPTDTLILDLTKSDEILLSEMKRKGRYNINLAQKKGITFPHITGREFAATNALKRGQILDEFWGLNAETTSRDGFSGHQKVYYEQFLEKLPEYAVLFFAEFEGKKIATAISTFCGDKAIYYFGASTSDPEYRNLMAPYGLQWEMIQYAKSKNCKTYDFLGIAPENDPHHAYAGISDFKWKFGGERHTYAPGSEIVLNPNWYRVYRLVKRWKR